MDDGVAVSSVGSGSGVCVAATAVGVAEVDGCWSATFVSEVGAGNDDGAHAANRSTNTVTGIINRVPIDNTPQSNSTIYTFASPWLDFHLITYCIKPTGFVNILAYQLIEYV
jgi:hypothetical protein